jgi:hypothetical protein
MAFRHRVFGLAVLALVAACDQPRSREILVFGDSNFSDNTAAALDPNNIRLYRNLVNFTTTWPRGQAKKVLVHFGHASHCGMAVVNCLSAGAPSSTFETTLTAEGYTVVEVDDATAPLTQPIDPNVKVILIYMPKTTYSAAEALTLKDFVAGGGRLVIVGDGAHEIYPQTQPIIDGLLELLGSPLRYAAGWVECPGYIVMPSPSIRPHQITAGLKQVTLACASEFKLAPGDSAIVYDRTGVRPLVVSTNVGGR